MNAARRPSARLWRIVGAAVAVVLVLAALLLTALRIGLAYLPEHAGRLRAWVEQQTHTRIEYSGLDARLRWYGPEIVLHGVRVLEENGTQALFASRQASVGLDVWNFFRTGQFVAGRVRIEKPRVTLVRLADGRIRLLGLSERPADRPPFDLDRLPAGRVVVEGATVTFRDLMTGRPPLELRRLAGELRRDRDFVVVEGSARLPESLGTEVDFRARLKGSLDERDQLDARVDVRAETLRLAGLADFLPEKIAPPTAGGGAVRAVVELTQGRLSYGRLEFGLRDVTLQVPARTVPAVEAVVIREPRLEVRPGTFLPYPTVTKEMVQRAPAPMPQETRFAVLEGDVRLQRTGDAWTLRAENLRTSDSRQRSTTRIDGRWWGHPRTRFDLEFDVEALDLAATWPLLLALAPPAFDRWAGLAPTGRIQSLQLRAGRERAGLTPTFTVSADLVSLGVQPHARLPGVSGLTAKVTGDDRQGTVELRAQSPGFDWPAQFREPIQLQSAQADVTWRRDGRAWVLATRGARLQHAQARAEADIELRHEQRGVSPVLVMRAAVEDIDVAAVPRFIPVGRLRERTIAWLDRAFVGGSASRGRLEYRGPVRKFPFRQGEGEFTATAEASDVTLDYYPGFAPLTQATGKVEFHNASIKAVVTQGSIGGLGLGHADFAMGDYSHAVLEINGKAAGDLRLALGLLQKSPLGPRLGDQFMGLRGTGPARYDVQLTLPAMSDESLRKLAGPVPERDYLVRADLESVDVALPALRAPARRVTGTFELHNDTVRTSGLRGTILGGPFEVTASPGRTSKDVLAATELSGRGRAAGAQLPAFIGLPAGIRMGGATDWELNGRIEKRRDTRTWPLRFDVASNLVGLEVKAPRPFAKAAVEARPTRVRIEIPGQRVNDVTVESGSARARLRFADREGQWRLDRGAARFDGQPVNLPAQPGLLVSGDWPQFDLGEWLSVGAETAPGAPASPQGQRLVDWLGPVDVHLDRATVFGFEFRDVFARLQGDDTSWRVALRGPHAEGQVTVPADLSRGDPIVLDLRRLHLRSEEAAVASRGAEGEPTDPRKLPALRVRADEFQWQSRQFGQLQADISRGPRGLVFDSLATRGPAFSIEARGSWLMESSVVRTRLDATFESGDFAAAASALGYRAAVDAEKAHIVANVWWPGGPSSDALKTLNGTMRIVLDDGVLRDVEPGAGRMLGLLSVAQLPRRLALDFRDVTDKGLAFNSVRGDFEIRNGNAYTENLVLKGPAVDVGIVGRTGLGAEDYDQTMVVSGNTSGPLAVAGALAAGPVVGAGVLVLSQLFKDQLKGLARVYYRVTGPWSAPVVERIPAPSAANPAATAPAKEGSS